MYLHLHSWTVCAKLSFTCLLLSYDDHRNSGLIVGKKLFYIKYYSIAFSIIPGVAGGLALELGGSLPRIGNRFAIGLNATSLKLLENKYEKSLYPLCNG